MKFQKSRFQIIKISQHICRYFTTSPKMKNVSFCDPSNAFPIILHSDFTDFRELVAQKLLYAVVYWSFSSTFLDISVTLPKDTYIFVVIFWAFWAPLIVIAARAKHTYLLSFLVILGYEISIFPRQNPYENLHEMEGFRARAPFGTETPAGCPRIPRKTTAKQSILGPPFPTFPGIHMKNRHNCIFWYFWSTFSRIWCTL